MSEQSTVKNSRYERKFYLQNFSSERAETIIKHNPARFTEIHQQRFINNIYLDTTKLTFFFDNVVGKSTRKKIRIRWYGELFGRIEKPVLEFKLKSGATGTKLSFPLAGFTLDKSFNQRMLKTLFNNSELPDWVNEELHTVEPTLINRYSRRYFQSFDNRYRSTIDQQLKYINVDRTFNYFTRTETDNSSVIVELKYSYEDDNKAGLITNHFPFRMTKSSKYVNGIEIFRPNLAL